MLQSLDRKRVLMLFDQCDRKTSFSNKAAVRDQLTDVQNEGYQWVDDGKIVSFLLWNKPHKIHTMYTLIPKKNAFVKMKQALNVKHPNYSFYHIKGYNDVMMDFYLK